MGDTKHTAGPWTYHDCAVDCGQVWWISPDDRTGLLIGSVNTSGKEGDCEHGEPFPRAEWEANRRLFASAPDLLAACKGLASYVYSVTNPGTAPSALRDARAAIDKAEGRANG